MRRIQGDLGLMELPELLQWAEMGQKDGTLTVVSREVYKYFFFQQGELIYFCSKKKGEQLGEFLLSGNYLSRDQLSRALKDSRKLGIPFVAYLISQRILSEHEATQAMKDLTLSSITDALKWQAGLFEFTEKIPESVLNGPIKLNASQLLMLSAVQFDHDTAEEETGRPAGEILQDFRRRLETGRISLPPTPDLMQKLSRIGEDKAASNKDIGKIIMADQILTSKILKVVNSPFYNPAGEITSLQRAIGMIGLNSVKSIATAHALSQLSRNHQRKIRPILEHSLYTAFIAKICAPHLLLDAEEIFLCAILHDIGKTVLFKLLDKYDLAEEQRDEAVQELHSEVGYHVTRAWNFASVVQQTVRFHHTPDRASSFATQVRLVNLADRIARAADIREFREELCDTLLVDEEQGDHLIRHIEHLKTSSNALI